MAHPLFHSGSSVPAFGAPPSSSRESSNRSPGSFGAFPQKCHLRRMQILDLLFRKMHQTKMPNVEFAKEACSLIVRICRGWQVGG